MNPRMTTYFFKILEALYDNQLEIGEETFCPLRQEDIATIVSCNRMTVSNNLKELKSQGYVEFQRNNKYVLTNKGIDTVKKAKDIE